MTTLTAGGYKDIKKFIEDFATNDHGVTDFIRVGTKGISPINNGGCYGSMGISPAVGSILGVGATIRHRIQEVKKNEVFLDFFFGENSPWAKTIAGGEIERVMGEKTPNKTIGFIVKDTKGVGIRNLVNFMIASRFCRDYSVSKQVYDELVANGVAGRLALWACCTISTYRVKEGTLAFIVPAKRSNSTTTGYFSWTCPSNYGVDLNRFFTSNPRSETKTYHDVTTKGSHSYHPSDSVWWGKMVGNTPSKEPFMLSDVIDFKELVKHDKSRYSETPICHVKDLIPELLMVQEKLVKNPSVVEADVI